MAQNRNGPKEESSVLRKANRLERSFEPSEARRTIHACKTKREEITFVLSTNDRKVLRPLTFIIRCN